MHNKHVCPEYAGDCKDQFPVFSPVGINKKDLAGMIPVFSTIGRGPRGEGVTVKRMEDGSYQFVSTVSNEVVSEVPVLEARSFEVINNTPNPAGGEPISVTIRQNIGDEVKDCNITIPSGMDGASLHTCSTLLNKNESNRYSLLFSSLSTAPSVGDSVLFKTTDGENEFLTFGEIYSVVAGTIGVDALSYLGVGWDSPNIGDNGNWWVGNSDTGVPATGPKGDGLPESGELGQVMTKTESGPMWADAPEPDWPVSVEHGGTGANTAEDALANLGIADHIEAKGASGDWTYWKFNSGLAICKYAPSSAVITESKTKISDALYRSDNYDAALPFTVKNASAFGSFGGYQYELRTYILASGTTLRMAAYTNSSGTIAAYPRAVVIGSWK